MRHQRILPSEFPASSGFLARYFHLNIYIYISKIKFRNKRFCKWFYIKFAEGIWAGKFWNFFLKFSKFYLTRAVLPCSFTNEENLWEGKQMGANKTDMTAQESALTCAWGECSMRSSLKSEASSFRWMKDEST
jgi:hypothetical protein